MEQFTETQLFRSCQVLFGPELIVSWQFLDYLQVGGIKSAYRRRALETHPDRFIGVESRPLRQGAERFHAVQEAYETLLSFLKTRQQSKKAAEAVHRTPASRNGTGKGKGQQAFQRQRPMKPIILPDDSRGGTVFPNTETYYRGPLPHRPLLFGHFLYYSGLANWRTITRVLAWQRTERPRLGELGKQLGMCRQEDIAAILRAKKPFEPFGETARMLGILSERQVKVLIFQQQRLQKKFGRILVEKNLISESELQELLSRFERHNATHYTQ